MAVVRIQNPALFELPAVWALLKRAFANEHIHVDMEKARADFSHMALSPLFGLFLGVEGTFKSFGAVSLPNSILFPYPQIITLYNEGTPRLAVETADAGIDFMKRAGYNRFWAVNASRKPDPVWQRAFRQYGEWKNLGSLGECILK